MRELFEAVNKVITNMLLKIESKFSVLSHSVMDIHFS